MPSSAPLGWTFNPDDPRAPPLEVWERMTKLQRARAMASLPCVFEATEECLPEGRLHYDAVCLTQGTLRTHFGAAGRKIYIAANAPVYYPGERMFSPDVMAVLDVEDDPRDSWSVLVEGKGLDLCIEIAWLGWKAKDTMRHVERYARLGIQEYFVFDMRKSVLKGYRLTGTSRSYTQLFPNEGRFWSSVLDLDLVVEGKQLRFLDGQEAVLHADERVVQSNAVAARALKQAQEARQRGLVQAACARTQAARARTQAARAKAEAARAKAEAARAKAEAARAELAEKKLAEALAVIDVLKRK